VNLETRIEEALQAQADTVPVSAGAWAEHRARVRRAPQKTSWLWRAAAASAVVGALIVTAVLGGQHDRRLPPALGGGATAAARAVLYRTADAAASAKPEASRGDFYYVRSSGLTSGGYIAQGRTIFILTDVMYEVWRSADGSANGLNVTTWGHTRYLHPGDEQALAETQAPVPAAGTTERFILVDRPPPSPTPSPTGPSPTATPSPPTPNWHIPHRQEVAALPTDPDALRKTLESSSRGSRSREYELFDTIRSLLSTTMAPPAVRSALYRLTADLHGVEVTTNPDGSATASIDSDGLRQEMRFDPATGDLQETRSTTLTNTAMPGVPAGTVVEDLELTVAVVAKVGEHPSPKAGTA
jgi:hypothetical protein